MDELRSLYQQVILDHNQHPRNFGELEDATHSAEGDNPLCGDRYEIQVKLDDGRVQKVCFHGEGCAISKAAASMMTKHIQDATVQEAEKLADAFRHMLTRDATEDEMERLGHLKAFEGVSGHPERIKCAVLAWHTLQAALEGQQTVSTEGDDDPLQ